ncbi:glycosyltransferase family 39 protein [Staphylococcus simulans]|uniref:glycosyltransferase family 39 protein n=1 Tax=Staphylococcus simulans TaxID=1286 RepID=UPI001E285EDB|nr:glycosyltransferase family 39 protein [Staphylococcus simulans]MCD8914588.1 glycosyltransferase family 39 protein [Staphylococcus simulans]
MNRKNILITSAIFFLITFIICSYYDCLDFYVLFLINIAILFVVLMKKDSGKLTFIIFLQWLMYLPLLLVHKFITPMVGSGDDDLRFEILAKAFYRNYIYGTGVNAFQDSTTYPKFLAFFYTLGKDHVLTAGLINITVHSIIIVLIYSVYILVFNTRKGASLTALLFTLYPLTMINTVLTLRELIIMLFIMLFTYFLLQYHSSKAFIYLICALISAGIGSLFHIGLIALFVATGIYFLVFSNLSVFSKFLIGGISMLLVVGFVFTTSNSKITSTLGSGETQPTEEIKPAARADYITPQESAGLSSKVKQIFYFSTKPFPWEVRNISDITGFFNIVLILISFIWAILIYRTTKNKKVLLIVMIVLVSYCLFAFGTYNYGTALRHRDKFSVLLMMFISYYLINRKKEKIDVPKA